MDYLITIFCSLLGMIAAIFVAFFVIKFYAGTIISDWLSLIPPYILSKFTKK